MLMAPNWRRSEAVQEAVSGAAANREDETESRWLRATRQKVRASGALSRAEMLSRRGEALEAASGGGDSRVWYVLQLWHGAENDVDKLFHGERVECWLPRIRLEQKARPERSGEKPQAKFKLAWPGYMFVRMPNLPSCWAGLATIDRVLGVLGTAERPLPVANENVLRYRLLLERDEVVRKKIADDLEPGQRVEIIDGSLKGQEGLIVKVNGHHVRVEVLLFGRTMPVRLGLAQVAKLL